MTRILILLGGLVLAVSPVSSQEATVFHLLEGNWTGDGTLMGREARFTMQWELRSGDVALLTFGNGLIEATAIYRTGAHGDGSWVDSRGVMFRLAWTATDSALTVQWTGETERGRTEYRRVGAGLEVRDYVVTGSGERAFASAVYRRTD